MSDISWTVTTPEHAWQVCPVTNNPASRDTLDVIADTSQVLEGFGGCFNELGWIALARLTEDARAEVLDALFDPIDGCKFSVCRMPIGASDYAAEWYSHNETPGDYGMAHFSIARDHQYLLPYIRAAQQRRPDLQLFASPWSPPTWMKFPRAYNHGTLIWEKPVLDAYALYFQKFIQAYAREGVTINQLHIQNEPTADQKFPSCLWNGEQFREFIADHLGPLFTREGIQTEIWLGTINGPEGDHRALTTGYDQYANWVLSDPDAYQYVKGVSYQWAGKQAIQQTAMSWPELRFMQSENECGDGKNTWPYAHYIFDLFRHYLTNGVNYYIYWNMVLEPGGCSTWGWRQNSMITIDPETGTVNYNPEFYVMKHFSHFIQPGAVRVECRGHFTGNSVVFRNPDGMLVAVVGNNMPKARLFTMNTQRTTFTVELQPLSFNTFTMKA